jgi:hypothetical protein
MSSLEVQQKYDRNEEGQNLVLGASSTAYNPEYAGGSSAPVNRDDEMLPEMLERYLEKAGVM